MSFSKTYSSIFIIGSAKCGTTALADILNQHPEISLSDPKETDFFSDRIYPKGYDWYNQKFDQSVSVKYRLDASVCYSLGWGEDGSDKIARRIKQYDGNAILIYMVRDPVQRAWSSYWHDVRNLKVNMTSENDVLNLDSAHLRGGMYYQRLSEYLKYFSRDQILVFGQNNLKKDPALVLKEINKLTKLDGLVGLAKPQKNTVNSSYQFNGVGKILTKVIPIKLIKRLAHLSNRYFPTAVNNVIRDRISKPIPEINNNIANELVKLYAEDADLLYKEFGVDVKYGEWWNKLNKN